MFKTLKTEAQVSHSWCGEVEGILKLYDSVSCFSDEETEEQRSRENFLKLPDMAELRLESGHSSSWSL